MESLAEAAPTESPFHLSGSTYVHGLNDTRIIKCKRGLPFMERTDVYIDLCRQSDVRQMCKTAAPNDSWHDFGRWAIRRAHPIFLNVNEGLPFME